MIAWPKAYHKARALHLAWYNAMLDHLGEAHVSCLGCKLAHCDPAQDKS